MTADVVVEIRINAQAARDVRREPLRPVFERLIVVTPTVARRSVKAEVDERADRDPFRRRPFHVVEAQGYAVLAEECKDPLGVPARFTELDRVPPPRRQLLKERLEPLDVHRPPWRQLIQHGPECRTELPGMGEKARQGLRRVFQLLHMRQEPAGFYRVDKPRWRASAP